MAPPGSEALALTVMDAGTVKIALLCGAVTVTVGTSELVTVTLTGADVVIRPRMSRALADRICCPTCGASQENAYGLGVALPSSVLPAKKSTCAMLPSGDRAVAPSGNGAFAETVVPEVGNVRTTSGSRGISST